MDQTRIDNGTSLEKAQGEEEEELEGEEVVWNSGSWMVLGAP